MKQRYDIIIIGAGIGGLVCGCYLSKHGKKVLILDRMNKAGGYCSSFERDGYLFDAGPHSFGSCRSEGQIGRLMKGLNLDCTFKQKRISNAIVTKDNTIYFHNNLNDTVSCLQKSFPNEKKNIKCFFDFINEKNVNVIHSKVRNMSFQNMLDEYFSDYKLKAVLGMMVGNLGLSPYHAAAFTSIILYREHVIDGGYYPIGGMQSFSNALAKKILSYGGEISLASEVDKIIVKNGKAREVIVKNCKVYYPKYVVSTSDITNTYTKLIDQKRISSTFLKRIKSLVTSPSFYVIHLGLKNCIKSDLLKCSTLWDFSSYDIAEIHNKAEGGIIDRSGDYLVFGIPYLEKNDDETKTISLLILAPFKDKYEWSEAKKPLHDVLMARAIKLFPNILNNISTTCISTPYDFYNYTYNKNGSISGWASTVAQINSSFIGIKSPISNMFHAGHWITSPGGQGGIPMVVYSGRVTAKHILSL